MKIAFASPFDTGNVDAWSGIVAYTFQSLQQAGFEMETIDKLKPAYTVQAKLKKFFYSGFFSKKYLREREPKLLRHYASQVEKALAKSDCDIVFSPGNAAVAYLKTDKPIVFWADATFAGLLDFYPSFSNLCDESIRKGNDIEQQALSNCRLVIFSSEWAARSAVGNYEIDQKKIRVLPFAANISCDRSEADIEKLVRQKNGNVCRLLFIGVDWIRKGGDIALEVARRLNARGIKTELHIVGCEPAMPMPDFVIPHGFISKNTDEGRARLDALFSASHFLILPTRAECFGIVFAEASSFGLPSLASNVGGIPSAIREGKNGHMFALDTDPDEYCDCIASLMTAPEAYRALALSSFAEYTDRLNWTTVGKQLAAILRNL